MTDIVFQAIPSDLLHGLFRFSQRSQQPHLFHRVLLANLRHGKSDMDQNPVSDLRHIVFEKTQLDFASDAGHFHSAYEILAGNKLDNLSWYG
jgi:hypothetical protein